MSASEPLKLALPKGRLFDQTVEFLKVRGMSFQFGKRELVATDREHNVQLMIVKNSDLPVYVHHGIAGLGVVGTDVIYESGHSFFELFTFPFGGTRICLAGKEEELLPGAAREAVTVATKFTRFTRDFFHQRGVPVEIIKLNGSVELAPVLGLAPFIVDLVETGSTLKAHNLTVLQELAVTEVRLIANKPYYKYHFRRIEELLRQLKQQGSDEHYD
ncbi:MAG: ATP phosphoribosyltransferase [Alkalispirochaetaceae bacterium]